MSKLQEAIATIIEHCEQSGLDFDEEVNAVFNARILTPLPGVVIYEDVPRGELEP
jgi:hypothetical protein